LDLGVFTLGGVIIIRLMKNLSQALYGNEFLIGKFSPEFLSMIVESLLTNKNIIISGIFNIDYKRI